jgi:hypothetical protein
MCDYKNMPEDMEKIKCNMPITKWKKWTALSSQAVKQWKMKVLKKKSETD